MNLRLQIVEGRQGEMPWVQGWDVITNLCLTSGGLLPVNRTWTLD